MAKLDLHLIPFSNFQKYFVDSATGLPLAAGTVEFFIDTQPTVHKNVYQLSGSPGDPAYTYTSLGSTLTFNSAGIFVDGSGNEIMVYAFPYEGTPIAPTGGAYTVELYYAVVRGPSPDGGITPGTIKSTWHGIPNVGDETQDENVFTNNYIPNGQLLFHNKIAEVGDNAEGLIPTGVLSTLVAPPGYYFVRHNGTSTDYVTFPRYGSPTETPTADPRYAIEVKCTNPVSMSYKDLRIRFMDVNKFSSETQYYTLFFSGISTGVETQANVYLIKNYGTGGDTEVAQPIQAITVPTSEKDFVVQFIFGTNDGKTIGIEDDDYIDIAIRLPPSAAFDVQFTDFLLTSGKVDIAGYPNTPDEQYARDALVLPTPTTNSASVGYEPYAGYTIGLPVLRGVNGLLYDASVVGQVVYHSDRLTAAPFGHLMADGSSYAYDEVDTDDHIPYRRLGDKYWISTINSFLYGTGNNFCNTGYFVTNTQLILTNNRMGVVTATANGATSPGFTIAQVHAGEASLGHYCTATVDNNVSNSNIYILNKYKGVVVDAANAGTSGFNVGFRQSPVGLNFALASFHINSTGAGLASKYCSFSVVTDAIAKKGYYIWFKVDGTGTDPNPAPGSYFPIEVDILSTDSTAVISYKMMGAVNAAQVTSITTIVPSSIPESSYFTFTVATSVGTQNYYTWYNKGSGVDPAIANAIGLEVSLVGLTTAAQVATATQAVMNKKYVAVPDYQGWFHRMADPNSLVDGDSTHRGSTVFGVVGNLGGTMENDEIYSHVHAIEMLSFNSGPNNKVRQSSDSVTEPSANTDPTGGFESRPYNQSVYCTIKY